MKVINRNVNTCRQDGSDSCTPPFVLDNCIFYIFSCLKNAFFLCWLLFVCLFFVNLKEVRVIWEEGFSVWQCLHQIALWQISVSFSWLVIFCWKVLYHTWVDGPLLYEISVWLCHGKQVSMNYVFYGLFFSFFFRFLQWSTIISTNKSNKPSSCYFRPWCFITAIDTYPRYFVNEGLRK